ncbi:MAG: pyruvate synthase [Nitrospira sp. NTP2]|nr:pyruvate synthase [Nitrospira sp. NTP2]RIK60710.1 MAG: pyruvate synthase [Nitrospira sp.]
MWQRETFKKIKQIPREEHVFPGTGLCAGCGGLEALRLAAKVLGDDVVYVNAAGCFTLLAAYPYTPFKGSWLYTTMGSAPAGAQGVRDALDVLIAKGRLPKSENLKVVVLGGDGSTYDMALSSTSGAMHRGLDFYYVCYDNEAYGNTGMQLSAATPFGARTPTSPCSVQHQAAASQEKKDLFEIWRAHNPPYLATVSPRYPLDLEEKFARAAKVTGPKMFLALSACPTGWLYDPGATPEVAKLAVETGIWPLKEALNGTVTHTYVPKRKPVEAYLTLQGRFRHLFEPVRQEAAIQHIQARVDVYWERVAKEHT